jgi:hypothetical protein
VWMRRREEENAEDFIAALAADYYPFGALVA